VTVQEIVAANRYMVLATADEQGVPWVTPVWFATEDHRRFYWISDPNTRHSRNIAARPEIAIAIFDSTLDPADTDAVFMRARAEQVSPRELGVFTRESVRQGLWDTTEADVAAPAKHRLYRATATEHFTLGEGDERIPQAV
jgi:nitroimidazol reductase NimA-like FMN-containing flavoprotein (pyridoxamine 5'-phosphate oxidase superfamily)